MRKNFCALALSALFAVTACSMVGCKNDDSGKAEKQAYVSLDINPAIELIVDKNNNVISVRGENEDGQVLLYNETGIKGEKLDAAVKKITDLAIRYGYLDENNKVVDTLVTSSDESFATELLGKVNSSITATASNLGLSVTTDGEGAYSLLRKMQEVKEAFPNNAAIQNVTVQKFKLALSVSETGEISLEAAIELSDAELIEMLKTSTVKIEQFATEAYLQAKNKALALYDEAIETAGYAVYSQFYIEKALTHPLTAYYGCAYQAYAAAAKGINTACDLAELGVAVKNYPLNEEQITLVATALGMQSVDPLKNANGEITVASIEAYADKLFKNSPASEELEQTKQALTQALASIETVIKQKVDELTDEYKPQIEAAAANAQTILNTVKGMLELMPESIKTVFQTATADLTEVLEQINGLLEGDKIEISQLREKANLLEAKAEQYRANIENDLTDEEKAELENKKNAVIAKMTAEKQAFEKALSAAEQQAKDYLENLKNQRIELLK